MNEDSAMPNALDRLRSGLIVSCQPVVGGPMDKPEIVAAFALAALDGGAVGLRIEGIANMRVVRAVTDVPIIGLVKRDLAGFETRITPLVSDTKDLIDSGADIIAIDATDRARPEPISDLIAEIKSAGRLAMADCSTREEAQNAASRGAHILGTTISGYTGETTPAGPDLGLVRALADLGRFVVAEGRYHRPDQAAQAMRAGADCVVVGSAITRPEHISSWFVDAIRNGKGGPV